jgi:1,4-dihydroxy-2-naphthoate octaprenyltransferase
MLKKIVFVMECSRIFSLPMTLLSWLVIFIYSLSDSNKIIYGIIALLGLIFAHLGTNLIDDYFDYKSLIKQVGFDKLEYLKVSQKTKCRYLVTGSMKESRLILFVFIYFLFAFICGLFLYLNCGVGVLYYACLGALVMLLYPFISRICLSELAVALAYGPLLFGGVYYVMTSDYSWDVYLMCVPTMIMTVILLYIHTVMDYEFDIAENKHTIANLFKSQLDSLIILKALLILAYITPLFLCIFDILDWQVFLVYLTLPLASDLYKSLMSYSLKPDETPQRKWYHFPMEKFEYFKERGESSFMMRMFQARNLMIYYSLFLSIAIVISKLI